MILRTGRGFENSDFVAKGVYGKGKNTESGGRRRVDVGGWGHLMYKIPRLFICRAGLDWELADFVVIE